MNDFSRFLLEDLEKHDFIKQTGSSPDNKPTYGTTHLNPLIIIPKGNSIKCVIDTRHLNSNTDQSDESWPIEPHAPQLARANKRYKLAIDLMYAYAYTPLMKKQSNVKVFLQETNFLLVYEAFMVSKVVLTSLQNKCHPSSKHLLTKVLHFFKLTITYSLLTLQKICSNFLTNFT